VLSFLDRLRTRRSRLWMVDELLTAPPARMSPT